MQLLAAAGALLGGSELALRLVSIAASAGCLLSLWLCSRRLVGAAAAGWSVLVLLTAPELQRRAPELLSDLPSLGLLFLVIWVLVRELERDGDPSRGLLLAAPLAAAAFYVRYGSALALAVVALCAAPIWWQEIVRAWRWIAATAALFAILMVPHLIHSLTDTGSALGIMRNARAVAGRRYLGEGLLYHLGELPKEPGGHCCVALSSCSVSCGVPCT